MKKRYLMILFIILFFPMVFVGFDFFSIDHSSDEMPDFFVGIDVAYVDVDEIKGLIDDVSSYTNLFVIGSTGISYNETKLAEVCRYLYDRDMYFMIFGVRRSKLILIESIGKKYPDNFLGLYFDDEMGGRQVDFHDHRWVSEAENYSDAAAQFFEASSTWLNRRFVQNETEVDIAPSDFTLFTSDYALYWFDFLAGYDGVFAQFGWNYSRQLNIALCRGAATVQNRDWGVMITWTYNNEPYIESGEELYDDLVLAYENGAKYVLVFDSNEEYSSGILKEEHLEALEEFWDYTLENPRMYSLVGERVGYVLPKDFAYGFRGPYDKIWGLWEADDFSFEIATKVGGVLEEYGSRLDIIYDDGLNSSNTGAYNELIFWNSTIT
jgi:hypothetical protein